MEAKVIWLFVFVLLYWSYCIFWGVKGALTARTASDYFIAGRGISIWVFVLAATATSFSGWTFMGHPGLIYRDGLPYAYASFYAITIPFTGVMFLKRQWMIGKRFGFVTPGEMLSDYFRSDSIRLLVVIVALVFSVPYLGVQLRASGFLFNVLTDGMLDVNVGMWLLSAVVIIYVASGGLRAVAYVDTVQCVLLAGGIIAIGIITLNSVGGMGNLIEGIAALTTIDEKLTPAGYSHYIAIPGVIQFVDAGAKATGGAWTGIMVLTYMFALMGIQSAPAFTMWAFSNKSPKPFAPQQVWASSFAIGLILFFFTAIQGMGSHLLGADTALLAAHPEVVNNVMGSGLSGKDLMEATGKQGMLVPQLINLMADTAPWLVGLLSVCALAAMQSTGAAYMSTAGGMLTRDLLKHYLIPDASHAQQKLAGRIGVVIIVLAALFVATVSSDALVLLGGLAVAYGFQMWPSLIAICWWPYLTRAGVTLGLVAGLIAVTLTESIGQKLGITGWGRWPLTIHSAGWGILFNLGTAIIVSRFTQNADDLAHKMVFHNFLREHAGLPESKRHLIPRAWAITLVWFMFGIGPGAVIGNTIFGSPVDATTWMFGIPSIWAWQILWWGLGVFMMWFLAYKMELSTVPLRDVEALQEDIGDIRLAPDKP
ncbi:MAG: sodium:solute symporter [Alphaproteobacteria bacterium]|jgi:Na+/proline symporter|nr:sodium:solute symporter [Alphaproteobacteria bacterium]|tara:strand:- start:761 stop:2716 length:1956 start_codon:yes stop_codon:yes gene_type:complete